VYPLPASESGMAGIGRGRISLPHVGPRITVDEFISLPESTEKVELLDGEVLLSPSPSYRHQWILRCVVRALEDWAATEPRDVTIGMAPLRRLLRPFTHSPARRVRSALSALTRACGAHHHSALPLHRSARERSDDEATDLCQSGCRGTLDHRHRRQVRALVRLSSSGLRGARDLPEFDALPGFELALGVLKA
jgi:hypothetical protein